jgi:hypothetical protein
MFRALIIPSSDSSFADLIQDKVTFYPETKDYYLCVLNDEQLPKSIKDIIEPVKIDTNYTSPIRAYQHVEFLFEEVYPKLVERGSSEFKEQPETNRSLLTIKSKLVYAISELLSPNRFHLQLNLYPNTSGTYRDYVYQLCFDEIPCYMKKDDDFVAKLLEIANINVGPLILTSQNFGITRNSPPSWYLKEMLRDLVEISEKDKILIEGSSGNLYLFYDKSVNVTEDQVHEFILEFRGDIVSAIRQLIFPKNTPDWFIKSRRLVRMSNGQWTFPISIPDTKEIFAETIELGWTLTSVSSLFYFLFFLKSSPTYPWIEKELEILIESEVIRIRYRTKYFPDYIRVMNASRAQTLNDNGDIYYPNRIDYEIKDRLMIEFYDSFNKERALVTLRSRETEKKKSTIKEPPNYDLETRLEYDTEIYEVI